MKTKVQSSRKELLKTALPKKITIGQVSRKNFSTSKPQHTKRASLSKKVKPVSLSQEVMVKSQSLV
jgi:hypothetical protein